MKVVEYIGEVLPDGHLSLPDEVQKELGLSPHCSVKITITVDTVKSSNPSDEEKGWEALRNLGQNAASGKLPNASTKHDHYLYGKKR